MFLPKEYYYSFGIVLDSARFFMLISRERIKELTVLCGIRFAW